MSSAAPLVPASGSPASTMAAVANEFLRLQREEPGLPLIDQMKLQKLLFYAHAWYMAMNDRRPLFEDDFEAWPWGPVIKEMYWQTRKFGRSPINENLSELDSEGGAVEFRTPEGVTAELKPYIKSVWDTHKSFSGIQLSNSTHAPGEPWTIVRDKYGSLDGKPKISNSLIADVFEAKLKHVTADTPA